MKQLRFIARVVGTLLMALAIAFVAGYLYLTEGWAKDLDAYQGKK